MLKLTLSAVVLVLSASAALAQARAVNADGIKWGPAPPNLPKGAELAVIAGDPAGKDSYVVRVKMPSGYHIAPHNHPTAEYVTVLSGSLHIGMGDKFDRKTGTEIHAGGFAEAPAGMNHYAWTSGATVIQVHGQAPFAINYVNPADDPSKTAAKK